MSDKKLKKHKRKAKAEADKMALETGVSPLAKKQAVQGPSSASSPASEAASASPKIPPVVAPVAPLASKRTVKAVRFEYGYPIDGHPYRPLDEFSDDDDEYSISRKKQEMALISELNESYKAQLSSVKLVDEGEDCPFWSHSNLANHSRLFFGSAQEMSENVWDETARRILIMREFILFLLGLIIIKYLSAMCDFVALNFGEKLLYFFFTCAGRFISLEVRSLETEFWSDRGGPVLAMHCLHFRS